MRKELIRQRVKQALQQSSYRAYVQRISLFGSHLHNTATKESDVDLLIEFNEPISMFHFLHLEKELENALGKKVDLSTPKSLSKYFRNEVLQEAEPLANHETCLPQIHSPMDR